MKNDLINEFQEVEVTGYGNSRDVAMDRCFFEMRRKLSGQINGYVVHMIPDQITIIDESYTVKTEKYLFFFLPREKKTFKITLKILVKISYI